MAPCVAPCLSVSFAFGSLLKILVAPKKSAEFSGFFVRE